MNMAGLLKFYMSDTPVNRWFLLESFYECDEFIFFNLKQSFSALMYKKYVKSRLLVFVLGGTYQRKLNVLQITSIFECREIAMLLVVRIKKSFFAIRFIWQKMCFKIITLNFNWLWLLMYSVDNGLTISFEISTLTWAGINKSDQAPINVIYLTWYT